MDKIPITKCKALALTIPTEAAESDGTLEWNSTTMVLVQLCADGKWGLGYTYCQQSAVPLIESLLQQHVAGQNLLELPRLWGNLTRAVRNNGRQGISAMAISAIDNALWDLKAKILKISMTDLLGRCREQVEVYGSGGFTSQTLPELQQQMQSWKSQGIRCFKMKVGTHPDQDAKRVHFVRECIGPKAALMVDANEAYDPVLALQLAAEFAQDQVSWFEQPVRCTDFNAMHELRQHLPTGMRLATGEYIYELAQVTNLLRMRSADVIQLDVTRCQGVTGFLKAAAVCEAFDIPISSHCAPALHVALGCALPGMQRLEYFYDHARLENLIFDGVPQVQDGFLKPDASALGFGLILKTEDIKRWQ
jgi:L-alanine-DL-glutamate epimerase-like enolase superfamily enzyme